MICKNCNGLIEPNPDPPCSPYFAKWRHSDVVGNFNPGKIPCEYDMQSMIAEPELTRTTNE